MGQECQVNLSALPQRNKGQVVDLHNLPFVGLLEDLGVTEKTAQVSPGRPCGGTQWSVWPMMITWPAEATSTKELAFPIPCPRDQQGGRWPREETGALRCLLSQTSRDALTSAKSPVSHGPLLNL